MKRVSSQPVMKSFEESDGEDEVNNKGKGLKGRYKDSRNSMGDIAEKVGRMTIHKTEPRKRCEEFSYERRGLWTNQHKLTEKQLKASWALEDLIGERINSLQNHYDKSMIPTRLKDVTQLLMPKGTPANELAALTWLGDWRPSAILDLLRSLSSSLSDSTGVEHVLPQLLNEIRIEEAIIDEEMGEIQANCILHLPFGPMAKKRRDRCRPLDYIQAEFEKIHRVTIKAQNLRLKALEMVVKKVLNDGDAAEFLVAFSGIQDSIHQFSTQNRLQKSSVPHPFKALGSI